MIKNHIATSMEIKKEDLQRVPFNNRGGMVRAAEIFDEELDQVLSELNRELVA